MKVDSFYNRHKVLSTYSDLVLCSGGLVQLAWYPASSIGAANSSCQFNGQYVSYGLWLADKSAVLGTKNDVLFV